MHVKAIFSGLYHSLFKNFRTTKIIVCFLSIVSFDIYATQNDNGAYYKRFQEIFEKVDNQYVTEPDKKKMLDAAISGMLSSLDPHSIYFNEEELEDFLNYTKGEFGGIGVEVVYEGGAVRVVSPIDDLPADKAGIKAGDYIISVDDESVSQLGFNKSVKKMRGEPNTKVKLSVVREGESKAKDYELTRAIVKINPVKYHLDGSIAYIRLTTFNEHTMHELQKAMKSMLAESKKPISGIILDLRNNPGGLLDQAVDVSEYFIDSGVIVTTKGRTNNSHASYSASKFAAKAPNVPLVVLVNSGSASSSEIVAGALQDYKRAVILGTKSFGKGSVQTLLQTSKNTAMKLTTAKYYTPHGRSIQGEGIEPDIVVPQAKIEYPKEEDKKFSEASLKNYIKSDNEKDKEKNPSNDSKKNDNNNIIGKENSENKKHTDELSEMYKKDYQYSRAYDLIKGLNLTNTTK